MKFKKDIWFILLILVLIGAYFLNKYRTPKINLTEVKYTSGDQVKDLSDFSGEKILVTYYAAWCGHCIQELPGLVANKEEFENRNIKVILLTDDDEAKIDAVRNKFAVPYPMYSLESSLKDNGIYSIPTTYMYNAKGEMTYSKSAILDWSDPETLSLLDSKF